MAPPNDHRLVLVYPPYSIPPTSPPLGVSLLKGFIQRTLPDWSVKVLDLNLDMHDELFRRLAQGPCLPQKEFPEGLLGEIALSCAAEVFHGKCEDEFYRRGDRYTVVTNIWLRLMHREVAPCRRCSRRRWRAGFPHRP